MCYEQDIKSMSHWAEPIWFGHDEIIKQRILAFASLIGIIKILSETQLTPLCTIAFLVFGQTFAFKNIFLIVIMT